MGSLTSKETKSKPPKSDVTAAKQRRVGRSEPREDLPVVLYRSSSMFFDEDGDLAHAFYEEVFRSKADGKAFMRRITKNLRPQIWTKYPYPRLRCDAPDVLVEVR